MIVGDVKGDEELRGEEGEEGSAAEGWRGERRTDNMR